MPPSGEILTAKVFCRASDDDPMTSVLLGVLCIQDCICYLKELPVVLKHLWAERQRLMAKLKAGEKLPIFQGRFLWGPPEIF